MSGMLHPEGPEPVGTYWLRRVLVLLAVAILVLITVGLARVSSGATRTAAPPPAAPVPSVTPTPSTSSTPESSTSPSSSGASSASTSASSPVSSAGAPSTASTQSRRSESASEASATCARDELDVSLSGKQMLKIAQPASFTVTVRNDGDEACRVNFTKLDFELKVSTGKRLVWSSRGCSTATFAVLADLRLDQSVSWPMGWDGRGNLAGCRQPGAEPKAGTYVATAQVTGAKAAKLPITLRK
jgi:hypothetical protein